MKYILIFILSSAIFAHAQTPKDLKTFKEEVSKSLEFLELPGNCKSLAFIIKIEVDSAKVKRVTLSDGLNGFKDLFMERLKALDAETLKKYVKEKSIDSLTFLMPVYYLTNSKDCLNPVIDGNSISHFSKFDGKDFVGECVWLESLSLKYTIGKN